MQRSGDHSWTARWAWVVAWICVGGTFLLTAGCGQAGWAQNASPDTQQTRPEGIERIQNRIEDIRQVSSEWRERLGTRLAPREPTRMAEGRSASPPVLPRSGSGLTRADLRRLERRLQAILRDLLAEGYMEPGMAAEVAERFRYLPADTVRIETPIRDTVTVTDSVRVVRDTVRETRVETIERRLLDTGTFRAFEVNFAFGESTLQPRATRTLDAVGSVLERYPELRVQIAGHTDAIGSDAFNQQLSEARAEAVRAYLIDRFGISPDRLVARGYGERRPIDSNDERSGRALNRRVEFTVLNPGDLP